MERRSCRYSDCVLAQLGYKGCSKAAERNEEAFIVGATKALSTGSARGDIVSTAVEIPALGF